MKKLIWFIGVIIKYLVINFSCMVKLLTSRNFDFDNLFFDTVVFTHNLGGGTKIYEDTHFDSDKILIARKISYRCDNYFLLENDNIKVYCTKRELFSLLGGRKTDTIIVNSLCSYYSIEPFFTLIKKMNCRNVVYLVHDYNCVCKRYKLISHNKYCGLDCCKCRIGKSINNNWRVLWRDFFDSVNQIICFSESSKMIITSVYANTKSKISVIPHDLTYCKLVPVTTKGNKVGILGNCSSIEKGKKVIHDLIKYNEKNNQFDIVILGKNPFLLPCKSKFVKITGQYKHEDLQKLVEDNEIGCFIFPSILPETFSYVVSEMEKLNLPIISLDIGAQGEKLKHYDTAHIVKDLLPETVMKEINKCFTL